MCTCKRGRVVKRAAVEVGIYDSGERRDSGRPRHGRPQWSARESSDLYEGATAKPRGPRRDGPGTGRTARGGPWGGPDRRVSRPQRPAGQESPAPQGARAAVGRGMGIAKFKAEAAGGDGHWRLLCLLVLGISSIFSATR